MELLNRFESMWQFAHVEGVEPTNNEAERQLRELVIYRKICLFIQSETGRRFIETIFSVIATKKYGGCDKKVSWCKPLGLHQILHRVLQVKPERPSTHPGMVRTNSSSLLNSLYPFMPEIP